MKWRARLIRPRLWYPLSCFLTHPPPPPHPPPPALLPPARGKHSSTSRLDVSTCLVYGGWMLDSSEKKWLRLSWEVDEGKPVPPAPQPPPSPSPPRLAVRFFYNKTPLSGSSTGPADPPPYRPQYAPQRRSRHPPKPTDKLRGALASARRPTWTMPRGRVLHQLPVFSSTRLDRDEDHTSINECTGTL